MAGCERAVPLAPDMQSLLQSPQAARPAPTLSEELTVPDPTYQLTTPVWNSRNRRQPPNSGGESYLRPPDSFGESYLSSQLGWAYRSSSGQVYNLGLIPPGGTQSIDDSFASACAAVARAESLTQPVNPKASAQAFRAGGRPERLGQAARLGAGLRE